MRSPSSTPTTAATSRCHVTCPATAVSELERRMLDQEARTAVTLVVSEGDTDSWPCYSDLVALHDTGLVAVDVAVDIDFVDTRRSAEAAGFVGLLRDCTALGVPVRWGGRGDAVTVERL